MLRTTIKKISCLTLLAIASQLAIGQIKGNYSAIYSGIPWLDDRGQTVSAHGACIIKENGRFYLFGEAHTDTSNAFAGFNCYSSADLYTWKFEKIALPVQKSGKLGPNRVGERVKVMKNPKTGEFVMYMHADTLGYKDQFVGYATSKTITGPYAFHGPLLFNGSPIRKWDMGTFQDKDGSGYLLIHGGEIYKLNEDYKSITEQVNKNMTTGFESPTMFRKDSLYYFIGSHLTSWERNDNYYYTATSLKGPWIRRGLFTPEGSLTWNSQSTFVLPIEGTKDTTFMFMGDRWSFPRQNSSATYVWQPLSVSGTSLSIPSYKEAWQIDTSTAVVSDKVIGQKVIDNADQEKIKYNGEWHHLSDPQSESVADAKDASFSIKFEGTQIGLYAISKPKNGYARVVLLDKKGREILRSVVDMYSLTTVSTLKFLSPKLKKDKYTLNVYTTGERSNWSDKRRSDYGSKGYYISLDKIVINN